MKKILFLIALIACSFVGFSQTRTLTTASFSIARDTVTDAGTETWYTPVLSAHKMYSVLFNITKISGTVGGTIKLVYSTNGTDFYSNARDTVLTVANASGVYGWNVTDVAAPYIGVKFTGTGTMSASAVGAVTGKNKQ